jgi:hypothetical protein
MLIGAFVSAIETAKAEIQAGGLGHVSTMLLVSTAQLIYDVAAAAHSLATLGFDNKASSFQCKNA